MQQMVKFSVRGWDKCVEKKSSKITSRNNERLFTIRQKFVKNKWRKDVKIYILIVKLMCHKPHNVDVFPKLVLIVSLSSTICYNMSINLLSKIFWRSANEN